jgi:hypothetical protein
MFKFILVLMLCMAATTNEAGAHLFSGTVVDSEGAIIANAQLIIHWDSSGSTVGLSRNVGLSSDLVLHTDNSGHFSMRIPPGFYDVFVSAMAFTPQCTKIDVIHETQYNPHLSLDPLVSKALAH